MSDKDKLNILFVRDAVFKILEYSKDYNNADSFYENQRDFDAVMMNFIIIGEMVARLSDKFTEKFSHIEWLKIRGFRNLIAHDYFGIDAEEVWDIIQLHIPKLKNDINNILEII